MQLVDTMKKKIIRYISIFVGILISFSLLSGANVMFERWYAAPKGMSEFLIMICTAISVVKFIDWVLSLLFSKQE